MIDRSDVRDQTWFLPLTLNILFSRKDARSIKCLFIIKLYWFTHGSVKYAKFLFCLSSILLRWAEIDANQAWGWCAVDSVIPSIIFTDGFEGVSPSDWLGVFFVCFPLNFKWTFTPPQIRSGPKKTLFYRLTPLYLQDSPPIIDNRVIFVCRASKFSMSPLKVYTGAISGQPFVLLVFFPRPSFLACWA